MSAEPTQNPFYKKTKLKADDEAVLDAANAIRQLLVVQKRVAQQLQRTALQQRRAALEQRNADLLQLEAALLMQQQAGPREHDVDPNDDNEAGICGVLKPCSRAKQPKQAWFSWLFHCAGED